jgi:hypothetical protein
MVNPKKRQRAFTKLYESTSYCLHFMVKDSELLRDLTFYNWVNRLGISLAARQVLMGFTLDLYSDREFPYICHLARELLDSWRKHTKPLHEQMVARESDLSVFFESLTLTPKIKKKVGVNNIRQEVEYMFVTALAKYFTVCF